jgi:hypothetical protein
LLTLNFTLDDVDTDFSVIDHQGEDDQLDGNEQLTSFLLKHHIYSFSESGAQLVMRDDRKSSE